MIMHSTQNDALKAMKCWYRGTKTLSAHRHWRLESFCSSGKFCATSKLPLNYLTFVYWLFQKFPDSLKGLWTVWQIFKQSEKFPDSLKSFSTLWKVSEQFGTFWTVWKVSMQSMHILAHFGSGLIEWVRLMTCRLIGTTNEHVILQIKKLKNRPNDLLYCLRLCNFSPLHYGWDNIIRQFKIFEK